jgi:hypothetical protein
MAVFWISFLDQARPVGQRSIGVIVTEAEDEASALEHILRLGIHPGGESSFEDITHRLPPRDSFDRLLSGKEARDLNRVMCKLAQAQDDEDEDY